MLMEKLVVRSLNHLLKRASWATDRLRHHAGAQALIETGMLDIRLMVASDGLFAIGSMSTAPDVTVSLAADTPLKILTDRENAFQSAKLSGSVDFAEALAFVFRNLRWDTEADLASYLGDIPARRLNMLGQSMFAQGQQSFARFFENLAEYASQDSIWLASRHDIARFAGGVESIQEDVARLEKRIERL